MIGRRHVPYNDGEKGGQIYYFEFLEIVVAGDTSLESRDWFVAVELDS